MLKKSKTINFSGSSVIVEGETEDTAAVLNASISEDGTFHINKHVTNVPLYKGNKEEVDADCAEFEDFASNLLEA